jgi:hypothetical protein
LLQRTPGRGRRSCRETSCSYLCVEAPARNAGFSAKLPRESLPEPLVLEDRLVAPPREGVQAHQGDVSLFSDRLFGDRQPEDSDGRLIFTAFLVQPGQLGEQLKVGPPQFRPTLLGLFFVAVLGQEFAGVKLYGRAVGRGLPAAAAASSKASTSTHSDSSGHRASMSPRSWRWRLPGRLRATRGRSGGHGRGCWRQHRSEGRARTGP